MSTSDRTRWNERYADRDDVATPAPPDALNESGLVDRLPASGRALDVACGLGAQSIWLAQRGFDVIAIDVSGEAATRVVAAARSHHVADRVDAMVVDLDDGLPDNLDDFDLIVCQRFRDPRLYPEFVARLRVGGIAVVTVLSRTGTTDPGPFHAPPGDLAAAYERPDVDILFHAEANGQESIVVQRTLA